MYLSKLTLQPQAARQDVYGLHQLIWQGFTSTEEKNKQRDHLFRVETSDRRDLTILVQSCTEPHWDHVAAIEQFAVKAFQPHFIEGQRYFFFLRANGVQSSKVTTRERGKKQPLRAADYLDQPCYDEGGELTDVKPGWLKRQAVAAGFTLHEVNRVGPYRVEGHVKRKQNKTKPIVLTGQDLTGVLSVADPNKLKQTYIQGLGRAKGFGFGLLSLSRIADNTDANQR